MTIEHSTDHKGLLEEISAKTDNADHVAKVVIGTTTLLSIVLEGLSAQEARVKFKCAKILKIISENNPQLLYPHFEVFEKLLNSTNNILKWNAIDIIANLVVVDSGNKFELLFRKFYGLLNEGSLITAAHVVESSPKVVKARPAWETKITQELLRVEKIPLPTEECRNILRGKVILAFSRYVSQSKNKQMMLRFAREQMNNHRPATTKKAKQFLLKCSSGAG